MVIFFSSVVSVLFYWGVMQYIIRKLAWVMQVTMATTAAESLNVAGNIFVSGVCFFLAFNANLHSSGLLWPLSIHLLFQPLSNYSRR